MDQSVNAGNGEQGNSQPKNAGPKFFVNIEGVEHPWDRETITDAEIAKLGGWEASQGVIEIDADNVETTVQPGSTIQLKPGHGFAKKIRWQRGDSMYELRLEDELRLLRGRFPNARREGAWFLLPDVKLPAGGWNRVSTDIVLRVLAQYPGAQPYGFFVPWGLAFQGAQPTNYQQSGEAVPFPGSWGMFSWQADGGQWRAGPTASEGSNLLNFALSTLVRLQQGA